MDVSPLLAASGFNAFASDGSLGLLIASAAFALLALCYKRIDSLLGNPAFLYVGCAICFVGLAIGGLVVEAPETPQPLMQVIRIGVVGISSLFQAFVMVLCLKRLASMKMVDAVLTLIIWQLFVALLRLFGMYVSVSCLNAIAPLAILVCFVFFNRAAARGSSRFCIEPKEKTSAPEGTASDGTGLNGARLPFRLLVINALVVFCIYAVHALSAQPFLASSFVGTFAAVFLMIGILLAGGRFVRMRHLYNASLILLEASIVVFAFGSAFAAGLSVMLLDASYVVFSAFFFAVLCNTCQRYGLPATLVFSVAYLVEHLAACAGSSIPLWMGAGTQALPLVVLSVLAGIAFTCFSTDEDYRTAWGTMRVKRNYADPSSYYYSLTEICSTIAMQYSLSKRESDVLLLLAQKKTATQISIDLVVSIATVKTHVHNIYKKLGVHSRKELLAFIGHPVAGGDEVPESID